MWMGKKVKLTKEDIDRILCACVEYQRILTKIHDQLPSYSMGQSIQNSIILEKKKLTKTMEILEYLENTGGSSEVKTE